MKFKPGDIVIYFDWFIKELEHRTWVVRNQTKLGNWKLYHTNNSGNWTAVGEEQLDSGYMLLSEAKEKYPELFI